MRLFHLAVAIVWVEAEGMQFSLCGFIGELKRSLCCRICTGVCTVCTMGGAARSGLRRTLDSKAKGCCGMGGGKKKEKKKKTPPPSRELHSLLLFL